MHCDDAVADGLFLSSSLLACLRASRCLSAIVQNRCYSHQEKGQAGDKPEEGMQPCRLSQPLQHRHHSLPRLFELFVFFALSFALVAQLIARGVASDITY